MSDLQQNVKDAFKEANNLRVEVDNLRNENARLTARLAEAEACLRPFADLIDEFAIEHEFQPGLVLAIRAAAAFLDKSLSNNKEASHD